MLNTFLSVAFIWHTAVESLLPNEVAKSRILELGGKNEDTQQRRPPVDLDQPAGLTDCHMVLYIPKLSVVFYSNWLYIAIMILMTQYTGLTKS